MEVKWTDRKFELGIPIELFPNLIERLRGTPVRIKERIENLPPISCTTKNSKSWSIQENIGHLLDLEDLWFGRLEDLRSNLKGLRPADMKNTKTENANHNEKDLIKLLNDFSEVRAELVKKLEEFPKNKISNSISHPRLKQPMTVVDMCFFIDEHDDHHLVRITEIIKKA